MSCPRNDNVMVATMWRDRNMRCWLYVDGVEDTTRRLGPFASPSFAAAGLAAYCDQLGVDFDDVDKHTASGFIDLPPP